MPFSTPDITITGGTFAAALASDLSHKNPKVGIQLALRNEKLRSAVKDGFLKGAEQEKKQVLPENVHICSLEDASAPSRLFIPAVPSSAIRQCISTVFDERGFSPETPLLLVSKGFSQENGDYLLPSEVMRALYSERGVHATSQHLAYLIGGNLAEDIWQQKPQISQVFSRSKTALKTLKDFFSHKPNSKAHGMRVSGVNEQRAIKPAALFGAVKNVYALAGGLCQGFLGESSHTSFSALARREMGNIDSSLHSILQANPALESDWELSVVRGATRNFAAGLYISQNMLPKNTRPTSTAAWQETLTNVSHTLEGFNSLSALGDPEKYGRPPIIAVLSNFLLHGASISKTRDSIHGILEKF